MNFVALKDELAARGFDDLTPTRQGQYINRARARLDDYTLWPYREKSVTGTAPLEIDDLGVVEAVVNTGDNTVLLPRSYLHLLNMYGDLAFQSTPVFWYLATPAGIPEVATYPTSTTTVIGVQYWRVPSDLSADSDTPAAPARWHSLLVDIAVQAAYRDSDNHQDAEALQVQIDRDLALMSMSLLQGQVQGSSKYVRTSGRNY